MAYKNKKKNKAHSAEIRKKHSGYKHAKKKERHERKHPPRKMSLEEMEAIISRM